MGSYAIGSYSDSSKYCIRNFNNSLHCIYDILKRKRIRWFSILHDIWYLTFLCFHDINIENIKHLSDKMSIKEFDTEFYIRKLSNNARLRGKRFENLVFSFFPVIEKCKEGSIFDGKIKDKFVEIKSCEVRVNKKRRNGRVKFSKRQIEFIKNHPDKIILILVLHKNGRVYKIYQISGDRLPHQKQVSWRVLIGEKK